MSQFPLDPFSIIDVLALTPAAAAEFSTVPLPDSAGTYEFHSLSIVRVAGAFAATIAPIIKDLDTASALSVFDRFTPTAPFPFPIDSWIFKPDTIRIFKATKANIFIAITPNVFGDTFNLQLRLKRIF